MSEVAIKLSKENLVEGLSKLSYRDIKEIMDSLIQKKLFSPPSAKRIYKEASEIVKRKKLDVNIAEEAVKWTRAKK